MTNYYQNFTEEERKDMLERDFEKLGIEMREDSKLCKKFIENGHLTVYSSTLKIATRMAEMNYLHNYTDYPEILKQKYEEYKEKLDNGKIHFIKPQVEAEYIALMPNVKYPETWPWMN